MDPEAAAAHPIPRGRVGEAEEFAGLVASRRCERGRHFTGTAINFDGGAAAVV
jgi:NAD(P)-dependent dehydrogenase (short-subunit alcohol dehydrogenase family)